MCGVGFPSMVMGDDNIFGNLLHISFSRLSKGLVNAVYSHCNCTLCALLLVHICTFPYMESFLAHPVFCHEVIQGGDPFSVSTDHQ